MKKILGLDLGTTSIGWAIVNEADNEKERSEIIKLGVRVNPLTVDEQTNFEKGKSITTNADRTLKRSMRRNLQRFKLRKENLIEILSEKGFITKDTLLSENGNKSTFETYRLRAKAVKEQISLEEFARVLLMINKKRGYKSSRKAKSQDEGQLIDGMEIAKKLYNEKITPGQLVLELLKENKKYIPDFYRSDLQAEFDTIWNFQKTFHADILTNEFKEQIIGKGKVNTTKIFLAKYKIYTADNKGADKRMQTYLWRVESLTKKLSQEELAFVISDLNGTISNSSGYLGSISDRSKELYFNKETVGQYLMRQLDENPHTKLKKQIFYRQDYLDEFNTIWETQAKYHKALTPELKSEIRDIIIFYQRKLKSQKGLISFCEFEQKSIEVEIDGKKKTKIRGSRVIPKSSPLFQEFKIWQTINNLEVTDKTSKQKYKLEIEDKQKLFDELNIKPKLSKSEILKLLYKKPTELDFEFQRY
jgi:CRISPR-associated endonuclease Csn1